MSKVAKTIEKILRGNADANIRFGDLCTVLEHLGFEKRIRGDHHIFTRNGVDEILNLQPRDGMAKAYQVKQVRGVLIRYRLTEGAATPDTEVKGPRKPESKSKRRKENDRG